MKRFFSTFLFILVVSTFCHLQAQQAILLPDGTEYKSWEKSLKFSKTYYVDQSHPSASDNNQGTEQNPFKTINKAAQVMQPGERCVVASGVYRELIRPAQGGTSPTKMISYEAAPGASVVVKGSRIVNKDVWEVSTGFNIRNDVAGMKIYQYNLETLEFNGYNPFGMSNIMWDRVYFPFSLMVDDREKFKPHALRRGMIFIGNRKLEQVERYRDLAGKEDAFWVEHNGLTLHVRLKDDEDPSEQEVEFVIQEQVFAPKKRHLGYIRIKGLVFEHGANGFPVPQRGIVSTNRGHHWIIEDCEIRHANAVGLDIGNETWNADISPILGYHIVRNNIIEDAGICGIAGTRAANTLVEGNTIENIGWQDTERSWESAGIKFHHTLNNVFRNNIIKDVIYAPGLWLDYDCANTRVTNNVICNIHKTRRGAIYLEDSDARFINCTITDNWADQTGGAVSYTNSRPEFTHCIFAQNGPDPFHGQGPSVPLLQHCQYDGRDIGIFLDLSGDKGVQSIEAAEKHHAVRPLIVSARLKLVALQPITSVIVIKGLGLGI